MNRAFLLLLAAGTLAQKANAQVDPHFSQYYVYPSWLNPALTGSFDGNYRVAGIYRSQWGNVSSPFSTRGVSFDMTTEKNLNLGVSVLNQSAGNGGYNYTTGYVNAAYTGVRFGAAEQHRLVFAVQAGVIDRRFNLSKLTYGTQWTGTTFDPNRPSGETNNPKQSTLDIGAGVLYFDAQPGKKANVYGGVAFGHITRPSDRFAGTSDARVPMRTTAHAGVRINLNEVFSVTPNVLYLRQGTAEEKMLGAYGQYKVNGETDLLLGVNYRFQDAVVPFAGFSYKNFTLGASYDINTSDLGKMVRGSNAFELSLSYIFRRKAKTPEVEFVCPTL